MARRFNHKPPWSMAKFVMSADSTMAAANTDYELHYAKDQADVTLLKTVRFRKIKSIRSTIYKGNIISFCRVYARENN